MDPATLIVLFGLPVIFAASSKKNVKSSKGKITTTNHPMGKGLFIGEIKTSREKFISDIKQLNLDWIAVLTHSQIDDQFNVKTKEFLNIEKLSWLQTLSDFGIKIWFWGIPSAYDIDNFIEISKKYENYKMANGYILNLEKQFSSVVNAGTVLASSIKKRFIKPAGVFIDQASTILNTLTKFDFGIPKIYAEQNLNFDVSEIIFNSWSKYFRSVLSSFSLIQTPEELNLLTTDIKSLKGYIFWDYDIAIKDSQKFEYVKKLTI